MKKKWKWKSTQLHTHTHKNKIYKVVPLYDYYIVTGHNRIFFSFRFHSDFIINQSDQLYLHSWHEFFVCLLVVDKKTTFLLWGNYILK